jgi:imidazolonepropionase
MKLFIGIEKLVQIRSLDKEIVRGDEMDDLPIIENAWMATKNGLIEAFGEMEDLEESGFFEYERVDCRGRSILPTWVDSHTHLVFADWRADEFEDRIKGLSYEEIANRGGGILNSAIKMQNADEEALYQKAANRLRQLFAQGTGGIEIKSGYGLTLDSELKMLRIIKRLKNDFSIPIKSTFLGAHAVPSSFNGDTDKYVDHIIKDIIPTIIAENLADYIDVFCEKGYFNVEQTIKIIEAGKKYGLKAKVHVNQFNAIGGIKACVDHNAISVDHLEVMNPSDYSALENSNTIPVALPSCSFFLGILYTPAREIISRGLPLCLATDFNPGSSPSGNMNFVISLACIKMNMTPSEAINAATINGAAALEISSKLGSITKGKLANFIITKEIETLAEIPYHFGAPLIQDVYINGEKFDA